MKTRSSVVNTVLVVMGILGFAVLLLPMYELTSHASFGGYSSDLNAGTQIGLVSAYSTFFGYGLYVLPAVAIGLGLGLTGNSLPTRTKALLLELIGLGEVLCLILMNSQMGSYDTDMVGSGYSGHAGFDPIIGYYVAMVAYLVTGAIGFIMMFVAPKPQDEAAQDKENDPVAEMTAPAPQFVTPAAPAPQLEQVVPEAQIDTTWICQNCGTPNSANYSQCKKCGKMKTSSM